MKVLVNAVSARTGGALSYLRNFLPALARLGLVDEFVVFAPSRFANESRGLAPNIRIETSPCAEGGALSRFAFDQWMLRRFATRARVDRIFSTANFGILHPPAPQAVFVRNPTYFSPEYSRRVREVEGRIAAWKVAARRRLVAASCASSVAVLTPTAAMRASLVESGAADPAKCVVVNHGFDRDAFLSMDPAPDEAIRDSLARRWDEKILFYPSLFGRHKNFDALFEGLAALAKRGRNVRLLSTCRIDPAGGRFERRAWRLFKNLALERNVTFLGPLPYRSMPRVYAACDAVVWQSFAESFGQPLLEAMACRRPIVSAGIAASREVARDAALYFEPFDAEGFADAIDKALDPAVSARLVEAGSKRVGDFSWRRHVERVVEILRSLPEGDHG